MTDLPADVLAELYTADVEDFLSVRQSLAAAAKQSGDAALARAITAARKPTIGAWVVNRHVHADPTVVERLLDLGSRLRAAHEQLDPQVLRELSTERRRLVAEVSTAALSAARRDDAGATLRDDVADTVDAAVADPQIAARLGHLTRGEKWSGFGVAMDAPGSTPELTVIPGGRARTKRPPPEKAKADTANADTGNADTGKAKARARTRDKAAQALTAADAALHDSEQAEHTTARRVHELSAEVERLQQELASAKRDHDRARQELRSARHRRREARTALTRAER